MKLPWVCVCGGGGGGGGGLLLYLYIYTFLGFNILNFNILGCIQKNNFWRDHEEIAGLFGLLFLCMGRVVLSICLAT